MDPVWIGIFGSLLGAGVGGGIAHLNAWRFARRQEQRHKEQEERREKAERLGLAFSIIFKVQRATEIVRQARLHARAAAQIAIANEWPLWQALRPFFGTDSGDRIVFTSFELALFAVNKDAEYANKLLELATVHNLTSDLLREYRTRRENFNERAMQNGMVGINGDVASFYSADKNLHFLASELEQLAISIARTAEDGADHAMTIANEIGLRLRSILQDDRFTVQIRFPVEAPQGENPDTTGDAPTSSAG